MRLSPVIIISLSMVVLTLGILIVARLIGYMPNENDERLHSRIQLSETLAIQLSVLAQNDDFETIHDVINRVVEQNKQMKSAALRASDGKVRVSAGAHPQEPISITSSAEFMIMPLYDDDEMLYQVETHFEQLNTNYFNGLLGKSFIHLLVFVTLTGFLVYTLLMRKVLRHLDPYSVMPTRVITFMNTMSDGVCLIDENDNIVLVNDVFSKMVDVTSEKLRSTALSQLHWKVPESTNNTLSVYPWRNTLSSKQGYSSKVIRYQLNNGTTAIYNTNGSPILDAEQNISGALITFNDITEREHKNVMLQRQRETERKRIGWLEGMTGFLKHEMRVALIGAASSVDLLQKSDYFNERDKGLVGRTGKSLHTIEELLKTVSQTTTLESDFLQETTEQVRLDILMKEYTDNYQYIYPDSRIEYRSDETEVIVQCQEERIQQMLDKLVSNAIDYTTSNAVIVVTCKKDADQVLIKVSNEGEPLVNNNDDIFDLFVSARVTNKTKKNQGIGLYVVRLIAEGYGGQVEAFNRTDVPGAEFVVTLPIVE